MDLLRIRTAPVLAAPFENGGIIETGFRLRDHITVIDMEKVAEIFVEAFA